MKKLFVLVFMLFSMACPKPPPAPEIIGLSELWPVTKGPNLVDDPGFEEYTTEADSKWSHHYGYRIIDSLDCLEGRCLTITDTNLMNYTPGFNQKAGPLPGEPHDWCSIGGWMRVQDAAATTGNGYRINEVSGIKSGTLPWTRYENEMRTCSGTYVNIGGHSHAKPDGTAWYDNMFAHRLLPPAIAMYLKQPNYKAILFDDDPTIKVQVEARPSEVRRENLGPIVLSIGDIQVTLETLAGEAEVEIDASDLPLGEHQLSIKAWDGSGWHTYPHYNIRKVAAVTRSDYPWLFDDNNMAIIDGTKTIPLGAFHTSGYSGQYSAYTAISQEFQEMGFNIYLNYWLSHTPIRYLNVLMDNRDDHGVKFFTITEPWYNSTLIGKSCDGRTLEDNSDESREFYARCRARELGAHKGFGGYYVSDEDTAKWVRLRNFNLQKWLSDEDPYHPTYMVQNRPHESEAWRDAVDIMGVDIYPIRGPVGELHKVFDLVDRMDQATYRSRPLWACLQFFNPVSAGHWPTYEEHRAMAYLALAGGADGIYWWSWGAKGLGWQQEPERSEYKERLKKVSLELRHFEPALISNPVVVAEVSNENIKTVQRELEGVRYIFAVNYVAEDVVASFELMRSASVVDVYLEDRSFDLSGTTFIDSFGPYEVHVYLIEE